MIIHYFHRQFVKSSALFLSLGMCFSLLRTFADETNAPASKLGKALNFVPPGTLKVQYKGRFAELPISSVKPRGWIKNWLERQADGLTGHPENLAYPFDTGMYAGKIPPPSQRNGDDWWPYEQTGYFVDGATRLSHLIDNPGAKTIPQANLKYILENSGPSKLGESTWGWPNAVIGRALMAEYDATDNPKVAQVLQEFFQGDHRLNSRDGYIFEEALYLYGLSGAPRLLEIAKQVYDRNFISNPKSFSHIDKIRGSKPLREHGVTAAEQLKLLPLMYCYTGDKEALELANLAYRKVESDSLMPDGGIVSSEALGTTAFNSMHETCDITDWSWSFGYMLMASGEAHWADLIEQATFNALPGAVTKDFKQVQYFSAPNQVLASNTACPRIAMTRMSFRAAHETQCCSGNVNRAMPNYVTRMWMRMNEGLAATLYGPSEIKTTVGGQELSIVQETDYPFRDTVSFEVKTSKPVKFPFGLRIPEWCNEASISINGTDAKLECKAGTFAIVEREFREGDKITLQLPMKVELKDWFAGNAVSVQRGPLVYALKIDEKRVEIEHDTDMISRVLKRNNIQGFPAVEFYPQSEWRYGVDAALVKSPEHFKVIESPMTENPFLVEHAPVRIEVKLRALPQWAANWKPVMDPPPADLKQSPQNPASIPTDAEFSNAGNPQTMTLVPYGVTHLRITTLPVIKAGI